jgi:hypothetical protein
VFAPPRRVGGRAARPTSAAPVVNMRTSCSR